MNKNFLWITIGVLAAFGVIYLAVTTDLTGVTGNLLSGENNGQAGEVFVPGTSAISEDGKVLALNGGAARNEAEWGTPGAPQQSGPIDMKILPEDSVNIQVSAVGFSPGDFKVKAGKAVILSLTSSDSFTHSFHFADPKLKAVAIGVSPGETRAIVFNAPDKKGEYAFLCDLPGHAGRGETGKMIVE